MQLALQSSVALAAPPVRADGLGLFGGDTACCPDGVVDQSGRIPDSDACGRGRRR